MEKQQMTVVVEQLPGEPIFIATFGQPFSSSQDVREMFETVMPLRLTLKQPVALILDLSVTISDPRAFSQLVLGMGEAAAQIRVNKLDENLSPPRLIFVGKGEYVKIAAAAMDQAHYGGAKAHACALCDEAITLARTLLAE
jgi:hypothetical protein